MTLAKSVTSFGRKWGQKAISIKPNPSYRAFGTGANAPFPLSPSKRPTSEA